VLLYGEPIKGSPVPFQVSPAVHDRNLTVVEGPKLHKLTADETYTCIVRLRDRFCNYLEKGGATVGARMVYSRQGMQDPNMLNQQNNFANVEDNQDGTYNVCFGLLAKGFSNWPLTASLVINCDKDTKDPQGFDVHSSTYQFNLAEEAAATHPDSDAQPRLHRRAR
jgi:carbohydrate-binding DOMON domain-containing protein